MVGFQEKDDGARVRDEGPTRPGAAEVLGRHSSTRRLPHNPVSVTNARGRPRAAELSLRAGPPVQGAARRLRPARARGPRLRAGIRPPLRPARNGWRTRQRRRAASVTRPSGKGWLWRCGWSSPQDLGWRYAALAANRVRSAWMSSWGRAGLSIHGALEKEDHAGSARWRPEKITKGTP